MAPGGSDRVRCCFLGTGTFAVPILTALAAHPRVELAAIVTRPARPAGRGGRLRPSPVAERAGGLGAVLLTPPRLRSEDSVRTITDMAPELLVLADYGQLVPKGLLSLPLHGALNLHPSLLPRHRGAAPIPATILAGDTEAGTTLMLMDPGLDTGPIIAQRMLRLTGRETAPVLEARLSTLSAELLADSLGPWLDGRLTPHAQPPSGATLTRPLRREDGWLDPERTAVALERQVRAFQPWPGSFLTSSHGRLVVWSAHVLSEVADTGRAPLALPTAEGWLVLDEVQLPGGRRMPSEALMRGRPELRLVDRATHSHHRR